MSESLEGWWEDEPGETYWLEITQREDLGADLRAPQQNEQGRPYWSYSLVREVADDDIVFHYSMHDRSIRLWSRASGGWWEDDIYWGARGTVGRATDPYDRPGWCHGLDGPFELDGEVTLDALRTGEPEIRAIRDELLDDFGAPLYFPFELGDKRPLRTAQGYLFKLPAAVVRAFPALASVDTAPSPEVAPRIPVGGTVGVDYRRPDEEVSVSGRDPFDVDPAVVERGLRGHMRTQNRLFDHLAAIGVAARSPAPADPAFDIAWLRGEETWVAEVKSLTRKNEERQLRLGLGQLLRYRQLLAEAGGPVRAVLMTERKPRDAAWDSLCESLGVVLMWPQSLAARLPG